MLRHRATRAFTSPAALLMLSLVAMGCGATETGESATSGSTTGAGGGDPQGTCANGEVLGPSGSCMQVGIQGCADLFLDDDHLCHPRMDRCPRGTIPNFSEGCVPVGISECAPVFLEADGLCRPTMARCADRPRTFAVPQEGCVSIDGADGCGAEPWGNIPEGAGNIYVDPSAAPDGDGSRARPLRTVTEAMIRVEDGGRVALAAGTYEESVTITKEIELIGRCPAMVRIQRGGTFSADPILRVSGAENVRLQGLEIGGDDIAIAALDGALVTAEQIHVRNATGVGVYVDGTGTRLALSHAFIEGTRSRGGSPGLGYGASVRQGAQLVIDSSALVDNHETGVLVVGGGAGLELSDGLIEGTRATTTTSPLGYGINVAGRAKVTLSEGALVGNESVGILIDVEDLGAGEAGADVTATRTLITGATPQGTDRSLAAGAIVIGSGQLSLASCALVGNRSVGLRVNGATASARLLSSLIEGTLSDDQQRMGMGLLAVGGAQLTVDESAIVGNRTVGLAVSTPGTGVSVTASLIEGTLPEQLSGEFGRGAEITQAAKASFHDTAIVDNREAGFAVQGTDAELTRSLIEGSLPTQASGENGFGIVCEECRLELAGAVLRNNRIAGLISFTKASVDVSRVYVDRVLDGKFTVRDNAPHTFDHVGDGFISMANTTLTLTDVRVENADRAGLLFDESSGNIARTMATRNRFGLVLQGSLHPVVGEGNQFDGNIEQSTVIGGDLPVPDTSLPIPH